MFEEAESNSLETAPPPPSDKSAILRYVLLAAAAIYVIASFYLMYDMRTRILSLEQKELALETAQDELGKRIHATSSEFKQALTSEVGMTKQEIAESAAVSGEVTGVKSDVGAAKTDIQKTQSDLAATNAKLEHAMGDLGVQSGLIAHNASELDMLKRKGERNYYDFTLQKGARTPVSTVSLQLKKVDPNKSKFTLNVIADDRTIEKKDRTVAEPLQFYTGRDHLLYEVVVFTANKNSITGYLSTPKSAPTPVTP